MGIRARGWIMVALAVALYVLALARDTSCATSDGLLVAVGTLGGFIAVAAALYLRFRRTRSRFTAIAVSVALALIPTIIVGGTASGLETDYCCSASGCR